MVDGLRRCAKGPSVSASPCHLPMASPRGGFGALPPRQACTQRLDHRILRRDQIGEPVAQRIDIGQAVDLLVDAATTTAGGATSNRPSPARFASEGPSPDCVAAQAGSDRNNGVKRRTRFIAAPDMVAPVAQQVPNRARAQ